MNLSQQGRYFACYRRHTRNKSRAIALASCNLDKLKIAWGFLHDALFWNFCAHLMCDYVVLPWIYSLFQRSAKGRYPSCFSAGSFKYFLISFRLEHFPSLHSANAGVSNKIASRNSSIKSNTPDLI